MGVIEAREIPPATRDRVKPGSHPSSQGGFPTARSFLATNLHARCCCAAVKRARDIPVASTSLVSADIEAHRTRLFGPRGDESRQRVDASSRHPDWYAAAGTIMSFSEQLGTAVCPSPATALMLDA